MPPLRAMNSSPPTYGNPKDDSEITLGSNKSTEVATVDNALGQLEVNFEKNVTVLYDSISNSNWDVALHTLKTNPEEARTWVVRYHENENNGIMWRFLPLHSACARQPPIAVVSGLLRAFPEAATCCDDQGMYPLHYACGNHAAAEVIQALVDANPTAASMGDPNGMVPMHYMSQWGPSSISAIEALMAASPGVRDLQDGEGYTPLDYAQDGDYPEREQMVEILEGNGIVRDVSVLDDEDDLASHNHHNHSIYDDEQHRDEQEQEQEQEQDDEEIMDDAPIENQSVSSRMSRMSRMSRRHVTQSPSFSRSPSRNSIQRVPSRQELNYPQISRSPSRSNTQTAPFQQQDQSNIWNSSGSQQQDKKTIDWNQHQPQQQQQQQQEPVNRILPRTDSSTPTQLQSFVQQIAKKDLVSTNSYNNNNNQPSEQTDPSYGNDRPTTAPTWNNLDNSISSARPPPAQFAAKTVNDPLPPRSDTMSRTIQSPNTNSNNANGSNNTPSSSVVKSLVKLNAEIVKLQAEAAFVEADMEERLLNQRESFQSQIDEVNANIAKAEAETESVRADLQAKEEYSIYIEGETKTTEDNIRQAIEENIQLEKELQDLTLVCEEDNMKSSQLQSEARELAKSIRVMRQEQEHILANLTMVEEDIAAASRARKKKLQAMFDEEMKYSMENVEMNRVGNGESGKSSVRQKLEEQKTLMAKCDNLIAECE